MRCFPPSTPSVRIRRGGPVWPPAGRWGHRPLRITRQTFPLGGRRPAGPDEGADERGITSVGTLISLASLDSFPLEGGSHYGTRSVRPYGTASSPDGLIHLATLGTWPYPFCPFGTFPPDRGNRPKGEGWRDAPLKAFPFRGRWHGQRP